MSHLGLYVIGIQFFLSFSDIHQQWEMSLCWRGASSSGFSVYVLVVNAECSLVLKQTSSALTSV